MTQAYLVLPLYLVSIPTSYPCYCLIPSKIMFPPTRLAAFLLLIVVAAPSLFVDASTPRYPRHQVSQWNQHGVTHHSVISNYPSYDAPFKPPAAHTTAVLQLRGGGIGGIVMTVLRTAIRNPILILRKYKG